MKRKFVHYVIKAWIFTLLTGTFGGSIVLIINLIAGQLTLPF